MTAITAQTITAAEAEGYAAYVENRPYSTDQSPAIRELIAGRPSGDDASDLIEAFKRGWERASDEVWDEAVGPECLGPDA